MKGYEGWSLRDKSFLMAVGASLLWHFFWFFSISITVSPPKQTGKIKPQIVSLGPVLDDTIFRTLVENRPQISEAFYRHLSDFSAPLEVPVKTIERHAPGDVVSVPFGKKVGSFLRTLVGGEKTSPDYEFTSRIGIGYSEETLGIEGEVKGRQVLSRPEEPAFPQGADPALKDAMVEIQFTVDPSGSVSKAEVTLSSGNPAADLAWVSYLRRWQFSPLGLGAPPLDQTGKVKFRFGAHLPKE